MLANHYIIRAAFRIFFKGRQNGCSGIPGEANSLCQSHTIDLKGRQTFSKGGRMPLPTPPLNATLNIYTVKREGLPQPVVVTSVAHSIHAKLITPPITNHIRSVGVAYFTLLRIEEDIDHITEDLVLLATAIA